MSSVAPAEVNTAGAPYHPSANITGIEFDFATHKRLAPGSDNWPMTWADDGRQYTAWGDGGGFGGTDTTGRVSNGFARIEGPAVDYRGVNVAGGVGAPRPAPFTGKCYGIMSIGGVLYAWRTGDASGIESGNRFQELWRSTDHAATWEKTPVRFEQADFAPPDDLGFCAPTFLQCGRDNAAAFDPWIYTLAPDIRTSDRKERKKATASLLRARPNTLDQPDAWEFFGGLDANGQPIWTSDRRARRPVWEDANDGSSMNNMSIAWQPVLGRCLLVTSHDEQMAGNLSIYEAPHPWGPWRTVCYEHNWGKGFIAPTTFFWNFAPAWWSPDGRDFTLVFTGVESNDAWNSVRGRLRLAGAR
ncbi:MAG: DUF4185 domain-containing protein [bacterium]|nr:DUF4185 domain-containing protein [bacterium]